MIDAMTEFKTSYGDTSINSWHDFCALENRDQVMAAFDKHIAHGEWGGCVVLVATAQQLTSNTVKKIIPRDQLLVFEAGKNTYADLIMFLGAKPLDKGGS